MIVPSVQFPTKGAINPQSIAAAGNATSGATWLDARDGSKWASIRALFGALGGGSVQIDLLQATDAAGTGSKALVTNAITGTVNNSQQQADVDLIKTLDTNNGYGFIQVKATNTGGTGALVGVDVILGPPRFLA